MHNANKRADMVLTHHAGSHHHHPLNQKGQVMANVQSICADSDAEPTPKARGNIGKEIAALHRLPVKALVAKYAELFGDETRTRNKAWLIKRLSWRIQANSFGGLSERARQRALEIADEADLRIHPPTPPKERSPKERITTNLAVDDRLPPVDTLLTREYKGRRIEVRVRADGFEYEGEVYRSLTAVAEEITGSHVNGYRFFRLPKREGQR